MHIKLKSNYILAAIIILQSIFLIVIAMQKQGYFIDEIYTYGLSNGFYKPFLKSYDNMFNNWVDSKLFYDYITVQDGEQFAFGSVYYNQTQDVHPPIHYFFIHAISSFFPNVFSKWIGLSINFIFFILCNIFIYRISKMIFSNEKIALLPVIIYGFTPAGINTAMYIRMYMLVTLFTVINLFLHIKLIEKRNGKELLLISLTCIAGFLTHYYFILFAFYTSLFFIIYYLITERDKKIFSKVILYIGTMIVTAGLAVLLYPASIHHMFLKDGLVTSESNNNLSDFSNFIPKIKTYLKLVAAEIFVKRKIVIALLVFTAIILVMITIFLFKRFYKNFKFKKKTGLKLFFYNNFGKNDAIGLIILLITIFTFLTAIQLSVVTTTRYIYNIYPLIIILLVWVCFQINRLLFKNRKITYILAGVGVIPIFLTVLLTQSTIYLYNDENEYISMLKNYSENYCLYINNGKNAPLTADLFYLTNYKEIYITSEENIRNFHEIFNGKDIANGIIVYIDTNEFWSSGYDADRILKEILDITEFNNVKALEETHLAYTYFVH